VQRAGVPVVNMRGTMTDLPFPFSGTNSSHRLRRVRVEGTGVLWA
jgi:hypothetical protein